MSANFDERSEFVALSRFIIKNEMREAVRARPHPADDAPGFVRMEALGPRENDREIRHRSRLYHESHKIIPKDLNLAPKSVELRFFVHIRS